MKKNNIFKWNDLYNRLLFLFFSIFIFRIGSFIPIPGINVYVLEHFLNHKKNYILEVFNIFSGGSLNRASIFALGIMPYISSSIIMQLFTFIFPYFKELKKEGEYGKKHINKFIRYITLLLSFLQSFSLIFGLPYIPGMKNIILVSDFSFYLFSILSLVTGTIFLMWLGELITEKGLGNGVSIIICSGILSGLPFSFFQTIEDFKINSVSIFHIFMVLFFVFLVIFLVVFFESSQRKISIFYANNFINRNVHMLSKNIYLPLKLNMSGVIPVIFSSSLVLFPSIILTYLARIYPNNIYLLFFAVSLQPNHYLYILLHIILIVFFCFFYTNLMFNAHDTANQLKKTGAFVIGIRPGNQTAQYIQNIISKLTLIGAVYTIFICLVPDFMRYFLNVPFYFGGTSLLIVVVVIMECIIQIQTLVMSSKYKRLLNKNRFY